MSARHTQEWISKLGVVLLSAALIVLLLGNPNTADAKKAGRGALDICTIIEREAKKNKLPVKFFTRLIWKESHFHARAVSDKGAQGIAQFMPETARLWGLKEPFNPRKALPASARLLAFLKKDLGNWGLAAAAYNAGRLRVRQWRDHGGFMPEETRDYVFTITGWPISYWGKGKREVLDVIDETGKVIKTKCRQQPIKLFASKARKDIGPRHPWGVHLATRTSRAKVLQTFAKLRIKHRHLIGKQRPMVLSKINYSMGRRPRYTVLIGAKDQAVAIAFCKLYRRDGGACVVRKTRI